MRERRLFAWVMKGKKIVDHSFTLFEIIILVLDIIVCRNPYFTVNLTISGSLVGICLVRQLNEQLTDWMTD